MTKNDFCFPSLNPRYLNYLGCFIMKKVGFSPSIMHNKYLINNYMRFNMAAVSLKNRAK